MYSNMSCRSIDKTDDLGKHESLNIACYSVLKMGVHTSIKGCCPTLLRAPVRRVQNNVA